MISPKAFSIHPPRRSPRSIGGGSSIASTRKASPATWKNFKAKGIGGVNLICTGGYAGDHPLPGVKFLGPEWRELFRHALREAARLKIEIGFNMAGGWVMMGPWVTQDDAMKKIVQSELKLKGPQKFSGQLPQPTTVDGYYRDVMVQAFRSREKTAAIDPKQIIDITDRWRADKTFQWDVPAGEWAILRTGYTLTGSKWEPYPLGDTFAGGAGYQIDCMNRSSLRNYFDFLGRIVLDEARRAGGRLAYLWADSWESGKLTWTQDFAAEFRKYRGYDLTPYLPAISGYTVLNADVTARFRADFDRTIADCVAENFYGEFARLCHENGVEMRSEAAGPGDNPPIDALRNLGRCDVPAGEFWVNGHFGAPGGWNSSPGLRGNLKQTSSAAHVYGKRIAQAEAFTQQEPDRTHWSLGPGDLKPYADNAFCEGINYFMLHQATCQLSTDGRPGYEFCRRPTLEPEHHLVGSVGGVLRVFGPLPIPLAARPVRRRHLLLPRRRAADGRPIQTTRCCPARLRRRLLQLRSAADANVGQGRPARAARRHELPRAGLAKLHVNIAAGLRRDRRQRAAGDLQHAFDGDVAGSAQEDRPARSRRRDGRGGEAAEGRRTEELPAVR